MCDHAPNDRSASKTDIPTVNYNIMQDKLLPYAAPPGRFLLALIFIMAGAQKITGYAGTAQYMEMMGVSSALLPLVILTVLGGLLLVVALGAGTLSLESRRTA